MSPRGMNSRLTSTVWLGCCLAWGGCIEVNGGAVELAWSIRTLDGMTSDGAADQANISAVALCVRDCESQSAGVCQGATVCPAYSFQCDRFHGATRFDITPGKKELWIVPQCPGGMRL